MNNECETSAPGHGPEYLLAELLDPNVPKSEREHFAVREIERLRDLCERASAQFCTAVRGPTDSDLIAELAAHSMGHNTRNQPDKPR